jgi:chromosomal replication initiator protein
MFRKKYRDLDLLAIDDIHFFAGKPATISEFQYTIDQLSRAGKQLVFSADRAPDELSQLGPELSARLAAGLTCPVRYPDVVGRMQILTWWCELRNWNLSRDVLQFIADGINRDCRRLSGALNRLRAFEIVNGGPSTIETAKTALADLLQPNETTTTLARIEKAICEVCGLQSTELKSSSRSKRVSSARMLAMWLSRRHTGSALSEIGDFFGGRSHSTVVAANRRIESWMKSGQAIDIHNGRYPVREAIRIVQRRLQVV